MRRAAPGATRPPGAGLQVAVTDGLGRGIPSAGLGRWLARVAPRRARGTMTIALVSDARMRALNRRYRGKDYATDVLSFPVLADRQTAPPPGGGAGGAVPISATSSSPGASRAGRPGRQGTARLKSFGFWRCTASCTSWDTITSTTMVRWRVWSAGSGGKAAFGKH